MKEDEFGSSEDASETAECALSQGKSRQMHDGMFEDLRAFHELQLARYARELGLDQRQLRRGTGALLRALLAD